MKTRLEHLLEEVLFETKGGKNLVTEIQRRVLVSTLELYDELLEADDDKSTQDAELFCKLYMQNCKVPAFKDIPQLKDVRFALLFCKRCPICTSVLCYTYYAVCIFYFIRSIMHNV